MTIGDRVVVSAWTGTGDPPEGEVIGVDQDSAQVIVAVDGRGVFSYAPDELTKKAVKA